MMEKNRYHFSPKKNDCDDFILSQNVVIPKDITQYLKSFQLKAIKFLYSSFETHKACVLNDESGLGKTVTVAIFLNIILANNRDNRKCLIICKNEERITNWKFHLDILTNLTHKVVYNESEIDDHIVYLTKWESLRSSASLANFKFDCIIVDNRENLMANKICLAYLLRNYENKISLIISNQDVTIDLKEFHSILRLCGRLEPHYRNFKIFEEKFELPLVHGNSSDNHKILESYFLRREKILDYCKDFCLRRFRHQYENDLPLVSANVYRLNVKKWQDAPETSKIKPVTLNIFQNNQITVSIDRDTEDLHNSFINKTNEDNFVSQVTTFFSGKEEDEFNNEVYQITTTISENAVEQSTEVMSPLIFIPDDSNESVNENNNKKIENIVSSTTLDKTETKIVHPTPIHLNNKSNMTGKTGNVINIKSVTDLKKNSKDICSAPKCKREIKKSNVSAVSRILTRGQDRITRSQAHKNKYLTLNIEDTIEKGKREIMEIHKRKRNKILKEIDRNETKKTNSKHFGKKKENSITQNSVMIGSSISSNESSFTCIYNKSFEPISNRSEASITKHINTHYDFELQLSGISLLDVQHSDGVHVIESTPELIVLSSSTDSSGFFNKQNNNNNIKLTKHKISSTSPDIFGSTIEDSLNIVCSQKSKEFLLRKNYGNTYTNSKSRSYAEDTSEAVNLTLESTDKSSLSICINRNKEEIICEIDELKGRHTQCRSNLSTPMKNNKITKYLKGKIENSGTEIVSSSSQSSELNSVLTYPKTPKKRKFFNNKNLTKNPNSATKSSPQIKVISSTTPTKTPTALTKWLIKPNFHIQNLSSNEFSNNQNNEDDLNVACKTRFLATKKRRKLDMTIKS